MYHSRLQEKLGEALSASLPIIAIVLALTLSIAPVPSGVMLSFLFGSAMLIIGMMFFSLGAELAMEPMGGHLGSQITQTRRLELILPLAFVLGFMITVSEPDLQVLAGQVPAVPNSVLIFSVAAGVGLFLMAALMRMLFRVKLRALLMILYGLVLIMTFFAPKDFLAVAFDSGGVTTGPMTVPFIMAFGVGISAIRSDSNAAGDSFGLIALCSVGPIIAVLLLGMIYRPDGAAYAETAVYDARHTVELGQIFLRSFPEYFREIASALLPIAAFFAVFQLVSLRLGKPALIRIGAGLLYTYIGLVIFLTGVNVGFMPAGLYLGQTLAGLRLRALIVPIGMLIGFFIVRAEPAVYVLMKQVEELTDGAISGSALRSVLSVGVAASVGLAMIRVLTGISILCFIVPGYAAALALSFLTPDIFTAIAFDSGGVASGPMTATFLLPFATGACMAAGGNIVTDAFGVVAMVAMTPLITVQILGVAYRLRSGTGRAVEAEAPSGEYVIIEL